MCKGFDTSACKLYSECENYMPMADTRGMESVLDMAIKQFGIEESQRKKLEILFSAYVSQYMAEFCRLR